MELPITQINQNRIVLFVDEFGNFLDRGVFLNYRKRFVHYFLDWKIGYIFIF